MKKLIVIALVMLLAIMATINIGATASDSVSSQRMSISFPVSGSEGNLSVPSNSKSTSLSSNPTNTQPSVSSELNPVSSRTTSFSGIPSIAPTMTPDEVAALNTSQTLEYADKFYAETGYTAEQKAVADKALSHIYQSLYLDINGETEETKTIKQIASEYIDDEYPGLYINQHSVMLMNYASLTDFKKTGEIVFDPTYTSVDTGVYTAMVEDKTGRVVSMLLLSWGREILQPEGYIGDCTDLKAHAVKAYELLKTTDLNLSKTTATYFKMNDFTMMYYLTDGVSRYFLTFGSTNKAAGKLYFEWQYPIPVSNEYRMNIISYNDMIQLLQAFDTSSMTDRPINQLPGPMGDGADDVVSVTTTPVGETTKAETPAQITSNPIWLWSVVVIAVAAIALVVVIVVRKKKKAN